MPQKIWIIRTPDNFSQVKASRVQTLSVFSDEREAAKYGLKHGDFEVWSASVQDDTLKVGRRVCAFLPGHKPEDWYPHKYGPAPEEYLLIQNNVPVGVFDAVKWFVNPNDEKKPLELYRNEIEMALLESDLTAKKVDKAMSYLPNIERLYKYLEDEGQDKIIRLIHKAITY